MIEYFSMFDHSKLFESIWDDTCGRLDEASITTFDDIHEHVWNHTLAKCKELLHKFYNKSFIYSDIDIKCFAEMRSINNHTVPLDLNFTLASTYSRALTPFHRAVSRCSRVRTACSRARAAYSRVRAACSRVRATCSRA